MSPMWAGALAAQPQPTPRALQGRVALELSRRDSTAPALPRVLPGPAPARCVRGNDLVKYPLVATVALAGPVAGLAALISDRPQQAARGAMIGGGAYALGATAVLAFSRRCSSTDGLIYVWTPFVATAGSMIAVRR